MRPIANSRRPPMRAVVLARAVGMGLVLLPFSANSSPTPEATVRKLQRQLEERDAVIRDLLRRVGELERRMTGISDDSASTQPASRRTALRAARSAIKSQDANASSAAARADGEPSVAQQAPSVQSEPKPSAPGQITATEEEAERALERTLTATGALLLPYGQIELEPSFTYTRVEDKLGLLTPAGPLELKLRRNVFEQALGTRFGLPWDAQAELSLPYGIVRQQVTLGDVGDSRTGSGFGDLSVGLAKTVLREKGWQPDLITRLTWNAPTGQSEDDNVALASGSGFNQLRGEVVALKRQDPLAFVLSAAYETTFNKINGTQPGDRLGFSLGAFLATSPETSLNLSLQQTFSDDVRRHGTVVDESDQTQSILNVGISSILGRQVLLNLLAGVGLTEDAPDYSVMLSLPIRLGVPVP